jgi:hypothetical protein
MIQIPSFAAASIIGLEGKQVIASIPSDFKIFAIYSIGL